MWQRIAGYRLWRRSPVSSTHGRLPAPQASRSGYSFFPSASELEALEFVDTDTLAKTVAEFQGLLLHLGQDCTAAPEGAQGMVSLGEEPFPVR